MNRFLQITLATIFLAGICLVGCGGGGSGGESSSVAGLAVPAKILRWAPPQRYTDNTTLNPAADLDVFEVYVNQSGTFSPGDSAMAALQAVDPGTGQLITSFNLASLHPFLPDNVVLHVAMRAVAKSGMKSDYSQSASFSF